MKKLLFTLVFLTFANVSFACNGPEDQLFCSGDTVISHNGFVGTIIGLNPRSSGVMVKWHTTTNGYSTNSRSMQEKKDLSVAKGCLAYFCVGDTVVSGNGYVGKVLGINPKRQRIAVKWHRTTNGYSTNSRSTVDLKELSIGHGCFDYFCVGDTVISGNGYVGKVIGLNPMLKDIAVKWHTTTNGYSTNSRSSMNVESLFIEKYCESYDSTERAININSRYSLFINGDTLLFSIKRLSE